jgi:hypothetical protein
LINIIKNNQYVFLFFKMNFHITITKLFNETRNTTNQIIRIRSPFMKICLEMIL